MRIRWVFLGLSILLLQAQASSAPDQAIDATMFQNLEYRNIGPANMGGRITDIAGVPGNPNIVYVATASGGLWKTTNGGLTWTPLMDREGTLSFGDIALAPSNPEVIWVGKGESNVRNSVSFGDGVYKSTDGGKTWQYMGLKETEHISRVLVHPQNPDIAYVGALGHAFGPHEERGVFMTTDGGKTWQKTLYIDNQHGVSDMDIDSSNPNILYAAMWKFERKPWTHTSGSEQGGVFKSIDGGRTWKKLENGLPKLMGRIGVKVAPSNPNVVYVICESKEGTLYRSDNRGETFQLVTRETGIVSRGFYYSDMRVDPTNEDRLYAVATSLQVSIDGGKTWRSIANRVHSDHHALWIDPLNPKRLWDGNDGGIAVSYDGGETWDVPSNIPLGQCYQVFADNATPFYNVAGGLQDNGSWLGPIRTREGGIANEHWKSISGGDGFYVVIHPENPSLIISESQGGSISRVNTSIALSQNISPQPRRNDGGPVGDLKYRFNWNTPIILSPHDKDTVYVGGNVVFKSTDFGSTWQVISPDLTTNDPEKQKDAGGPVWIENTTAEYHCTIISLAESPIKPGVIWVGTDDGNLQVTTDGGENWTNLTKNVPGMPFHSPVSHVEPSHTDLNVAYVSFDRHMFDDFRPYVFKTTDGGRTWTNITGNLPEKGYVHVVREDPKNPGLLYCGTELGLYVSYTGGRYWFPLNMKNLPNVSVHDIQVHPRENDLILATHGRSIWIFDDLSSIQQMTPEIAGKDAYLFDIRPALRTPTRGGFGGFGRGDRPFIAPNPPSGALITYYLKEKPDPKKEVKIQILDSGGKVIRELSEVPKEKGLNRTNWDMRLEAARRRTPETEEETRGRRFGFGGGPQVLPGNYTVRLIVGDTKLDKPVQVRLDPVLEPYLTSIKEGHQMALQIRDMQTALNEGTEKLTSVKEQLQAIQRTLRERMPNAPKELTKAIEDHLKHIDDINAKIENPRNIPFYTRGPKLRSRLGSLSGMMDNHTGPTPTQKEFFREVETEFKQVLAEINKCLTEECNKLNEQLKKSNAPIVITGGEVKMP